MKALVALLSLVVVTAQAATLEDFARVYAMPAESTTLEASWAPNTDFPGGERWSQLVHQNSLGEYVLRARVKLKRQGMAQVWLGGSKDDMKKIEFTIFESEGKLFEQEEFDTAVRAQFGKGVAVEPVSRCSISVLSGLAVYKVTLPGRRPFHVAAMVDSGGTLPKSRASTFEFSQLPLKRWSCGV